ncbi:MAG: hypothetical protein CV087_05605 [Candidatus Brocadia sp. WS118]|nr:MAG: hypothetical protein CV087_05605 [Candidatus Brocadia sp. WS118]
MDLRLSQPLEVPLPGVVFPTGQPFSNFDYIEGEDFRNCRSLPRIFSQVRQLGFQTMVVEKIHCVGFASEEDRDFGRHEKDFSGSNLRRLSFFKNQFKDLSEIQECTDSDFLGYAILKGNQFTNAPEEWNVFESVIRSSEKPNNYSHTIRCYNVLVYSKHFNILGNLYCDQNGRTNCCAHTALRSVIAATEVGDISYAEINLILEKIKIPFQRDRKPKALTIPQVCKVLDAKGIRYTRDYVTKTSDNDTWSERDHQKLMRVQSRIYKSIEVGCPAFVGFTWKEQRKPEFGEEQEGHAISIFGHTFNDDTWVPRAATQYFTVGRSARYVSSEEWTSTYIGHDESLGSNYCIPRWYLINNPDITSIHVLAVLPNNAELDPVEAEAITICCLDEIMVQQFENTKQYLWFNRLKAAVEGQTVVLRSLFLSGERYLDHLAEIRGWNDRQIECIDKNTIEDLRKVLKGFFWIVEISVQELFPANRRKLGEIVLKATKASREDGDYSNFVFARLPGTFVYPQVLGKLIPLVTSPSQIGSHTELINVHQ